MRFKSEIITNPSENISQISLQFANESNIWAKYSMNITSRVHNLSENSLKSTAEIKLNMKPISHNISVTVETHVDSGVVNSESTILDYFGQTLQSMLKFNIFTLSKIKINTLLFQLVQIMTE